MRLKVYFVTIFLFFSCFSDANLEEIKQEIKRNLLQTLKDYEPLIEHEIVGFDRDSELFKRTIDKNSEQVQERLRFLERLERNEFEDIPKLKYRFNAYEKCFGAVVNSYFCYFFKINLESETTRYSEIAREELSTYMPVRDIFKSRFLGGYKSSDSLSKELNKRAEMVLNSFKGDFLDDGLLSELKNKKIDINSLSEKDKYFLVENEYYIKNLLRLSKYFKLGRDYSIIYDLENKQIGIKEFLKSDFVGVNLFIDNTPRSYILEDALISTFTDLVYQNSILVDRLGFNKQYIDYPFANVPFIDEIHYSYSTTVNLLLYALGKEAGLSNEAIWKMQLVYSNGSVSHKHTSRDYSFSFNGKHSKWLIENGFSPEFVNDLSNWISEKLDIYERMKQNARLKARGVLEFFTRFESRLLPMAIIDGKFVIRGLELHSIHSDLQSKIFEYVLLVNKLSSIGLFNFNSENNIDVLSGIGLKFKSSSLSSINKYDWYHIAVLLFNFDASFQFYENNKNKQ